MARKKKTKKKSLLPVVESETIHGRGAYHYKTEQDFQTAVEDYFLSLKRTQAPSKSGLCVFLDLSRETLRQYGKTRYKEVCHMANERIKIWWINRLGKSSPIGAIFFLKNFDKAEFKDRVSGDPENPLTVQITGMRIVKDK